MENMKQIKITAREIKKDKQVFIACSSEINKKWYKIKFIKECTGVPKKAGLYELTIDLNECSLERGKTYTKKNGEIGYENDTIWVKTIAGLRPYTAEELAEMNRVTMAGIFGE